MRTASSTPGMNDSRESVSWRTRQRLAEAAEDHLLTGDQARVAARCGSAGPCARRPRSISSAVRFAVPEGASSFASWCSSTISQSGMWGAISFAASIISTAPIAKFGAIRQLPFEPRGERAQLLELLGGEPGRADHHVRAVLQAQAGVLEHGVRDREVDDDVRAATRVSACSSETPSAGIDARHQLHVVRRLDRLADGLPHAPRGAGDGDADHAAPASSALTGASALRKRPSSRPIAAADMPAGG